MKIIAASFRCESNSRSSYHPQQSDFEYLVGNDIFRKLVVQDIFFRAGFEVIPSICANALPSGTVELSVYRYYVDQILSTVRDHADADGIFLYLHGSMEVEDVGSGELFLLKEIRKIVPRSCLIALTLDLHANITDELGDYADIICGYKTAPHVDQAESQVRAATALISCLKKNIRPYTYIQKIPMLVKGDTMLTREEPLRSLEEMTRHLEEQESIFGANLFFGHCWIDAPNTAASAVVSAESKEEAERLAKDLANRLWNTRKEYRFQIEAEAAEECVRLALEGTERRIFITDSGDNTTAGAEGNQTALLELLIQAKPDKKTCVAGITSPEILNTFWDLSDGEKVILPILDGTAATVLSHGKILGWTKEIIGRSLSFTIGNIDVIFTELRSAFIEKGNFDKAETDLLSYRIVVVKLGYLFDELKPYADRELFALTDGDSCVELSRLGLTKIRRPMFPLEDFEWNANE